jgi:hypothetical protein
MSGAFVKEDDAMWLGDIAPTMNALINFLSKENGVRITERSSYIDETSKKQVYKMSDGFSYTVQENKWVCLD